MNLLLIDDDQALRSQIRFSIENLFEEVFEAGDKETSLSLLENEPIDIALVDLHLIGPHDGVEIANETVEQGIKTIIFTANRSEETTKELIKNGVFDYINKPVEIPLLKEALKRAMLFCENERKLAEENVYHVSMNLDLKSGIKKSLSSVEKDLLIKVLKQNDFNIYHTAKVLNIKRENIYYFMKKYNITRD